MLTDEDVRSHDRLIGAIETMSIESLSEAYRIARRDYEPLLIYGSDAQEAEVRSEILACEIAIGGSWIQPAFSCAEPMTSRLALR